MQFVCLNYNNDVLKISGDQSEWTQDLYLSGKRNDGYIVS